MKRGRCCVQPRLSGSQAGSSTPVLLAVEWALAPQELLELLLCTRLLARLPEVASDLMTRVLQVLQRLCFCGSAAGLVLEVAQEPGLRPAPLWGHQHMPAFPRASPKTGHIPEPIRGGHLPRSRPHDRWPEDSGSRPYTTLWQLFPERHQHQPHHHPPSTHLRALPQQAPGHPAGALGPDGACQAACKPQAALGCQSLHPPNAGPRPQPLKDPHQRQKPSLDPKPTNNFSCSWGLLSF